MSMNLAQRAGSVLTIFVAMLLASCGGGGDGSAVQPPAAPSNSSVMGLWSLTETSKTSSNANCQPPADPLSISLAFVSQSGNNLTMMFAANPIAASGADGGVFTGTITSGAVSLTGSHPVGAGNGMETLNPVSITVAASCNSLTGSASFSFTQTTPSSLTCTGTMQFSGTRAVGSGCAGTIANAAVLEQVIAHNSIATAQTITRSSAISGSLPISNAASTTEYDWYRLVLSAAAPVTMALTGPVGQDIDLYLYASDGTIPIAASFSETSNESLSQSLAAGTYFIVVRPVSVTVASNYTLVVQ